MRTLVIVLLLLAAAALIYLFVIRDQEALQEPATPTAVESEEPTEDSEEVAQETLPLPRFDIVRVDRNGFAQIAGRAAPNAVVDVLANGDVLISETALANGDWATFTETPLASGAVELGLRMTTTDGMTIVSDETIIIYVPEADGDAPVVLRTTPGGATQILQSANDDVEGLSPLSVDTIDYDGGGNVIFSGRAEPKSMVQVFADRRLVGQASADNDGRWELSASLPPGRYTLQIIQLDEDGEPKYAIEVPFEQATLDDIVLKDGNVIVQPGNNLWVISRTVYGKGAQYTVIYQANADQIRDPDLIYPGQIFRLPEEQPEAEE